MRDETRPDYRRTKVAALQQLASGGDLAAMRELERRGIAVTTAIDVRQLDYHGLRALVRAWATGPTLADRTRRSALARAAQDELEARYRTSVTLGSDERGRTPQPPPMPPWLAPRPPRCEDWQRPQYSTCYPDERYREPSPEVRASWARATERAKQR